jgi:hypothetical protein
VAEGVKDLDRLTIAAIAVLWIAAAAVGLGVFVFVLGPGIGKI